MAGRDPCNPTVLYPVAAQAPSRFCDRMIRLTCNRGRLRTPCKPRVRFAPHNRRRKSTSHAGDEKLIDMVCDVLNHLDPTKVRSPHQVPRLGDPPLAPEHGIGHSPLAPDHGIRDVVVEISSLMQSLSIETEEGEAVHTNSESDNDDGTDDEESHGTDDEDVESETFVIEAAKGSLMPSQFKLPIWIYLKFHTYQRKGLDWLWSLHCMGVGGILSDDMELGKTIQVAAFLAGLFHSGLIKRALIVCPNIVLTQWVKELTEVGLKEKIRQFLSSNRSARKSELNHVIKEGGVLLTTYDTVRHNYMVIKRDPYNQSDDDEEGVLWNYVIVDEGHMIKDPKTKRAKSLHAIPCIHRIIVTGTPLQNRFMEMWALLSFCCPEVLGDMDKFKTTYEKSIVRGNNKDATKEEKQTGSAVATEFRKQISPYFLRRMKGEVQFDAGPSEQTRLSNKYELVIWLKLTDFQREMYSAFLKGARVDLSSQGSVFSKISTLKKICEHPGSLDLSKYIDRMSDNPESRKFLKMVRELKDMSDTAGTLEVGKFASSKLIFIMSLLKILLNDNCRILIFSETLYILDCIEEAIKLEGYRFIRIDGKTEVSERKRLVQEFQRELGGLIFLLSTKVGALGVTLTNASRVILVNPSWNPSTDSQSVDRAYRYGQTKDVTVYRLITSGTIEEKIYKLQVFKGALFQTATRKKKPKLYFNKEEAEEVLSLPKQGFDVSLTQQQLENEHHGQSIDESLRMHIKILEQQGIAGVSQHSFLFRETTILPPMG